MPSNVGRTQYDKDMQELAMFGCMKAELDLIVAAPHRSARMVVLTMLSDAQEEMREAFNVGSWDQHEKARHLINRAKYIADEYLRPKPNKEETEVINTAAEMLGDDRGGRKLLWLLDPRR